MSTESEPPVDSDELSNESDQLLNLVTNFNRIDSQEVMAALLYLWAITSGVSEAALDRLLKLLLVILPYICWPSSVKTMKTLIKRHLIDEETPLRTFFACDSCLTRECTDASHIQRSKVIMPSLVKQVCLLSSKIPEINEYEIYMQRHPGCYVLCGKYAREANDMSSICSF